MSDGPPPGFPEIKRLDFSGFHATGDHWPFTRYCQAQAGGWRVHLDYAWHYHRRDQVLFPWHWLKCKTGHHTVVNGWRRDDDSHEMRPSSWCSYCDVPMAPTGKPSRGPR